MTEILFKEWLGNIAELTENQKISSIDKIQVRLSENYENGYFIPYGKVKSGIPPAIADAVADHCPHCYDTKITKCGKASGLQRWECKDCDNKSFNILTKTPLARLRKKEKWLMNAQGMIDGLSVRRLADLCGVHYNTIFRWRHRFAENLGKIQCQGLSGFVECDATLFYHSGKGSRDLERKPRKRGGDGIPRGFGSHLVSVITVRDRNGEGADRIAPDCVAAHAANLFDVHINYDDTLLLTDGDKSLCAAAKRETEEDIAEFIVAKAVQNVADMRNPTGHKALIGKEKSRGKKGDPYHIQTINAFHSHLKRWMTRFYGVATKYLKNYVGWHRHLMERHHNDDPNRFIQLVINPLSVNPELTVI